MLNANAVAYMQAVISGIGDHNSVSAGPDDGANNYLACAFWNSMRHSTTRQAIDNFKGRLSLPVTHPFSIAALNLAGHGNEGILTTGCGQTGQSDYKTNYITGWNEFVWGPVFDELQPANITMLTIWSCHTGAGESGADLLYAIAKRIKKPVRGNTGFLYSNSNCQVWMENGAVWQVATPDYRPAPIAAPSPHFIPMTKSASTIDLGKVKIPTGDIKQISFKFDGHEVSRTSASLEDKDIIEAVASELANSPCFEMPGSPAAFKTAELHIVHIANGKSAEETISIFNDRLGVSKDGAVGFYVGNTLLTLMQTYRGDR